jgi:hypothetical protein
MVSFGRLLGPVREMHTFAFGERSVGVDGHGRDCGLWCSCWLSRYLLDCSRIPDSNGIQRCRRYVPITKK